MDFSLLRSFRVPMMMPKSDLDYNPISPIIIDSIKPWERSVNSFSHSREGYDCLGNYVLNEITHERASREFNKFMSIIILNDFIILALMLFSFRDYRQWKLWAAIGGIDGTKANGARSVWHVVRWIERNLVLDRVDGFVEMWGWLLWRNCGDRGWRSFRHRMKVITQINSHVTSSPNRSHQYKSIAHFTNPSPLSHTFSSQ